MGLQVCATMLWFLKAGDPKSGLYACIESILPTEPSSQIQRAVSERKHFILIGLDLQGFFWLHLNCICKRVLSGYFQVKGLCYA